MVDLERKIRATQAQQGGFSTVVLPRAVQYAGLLGGGILIAGQPSTGLNLNPVTSSEFSGSSTFSTLDAESNEWAVVQPGPQQGTIALGYTVDFANEDAGLCFASNFASSLNLQQISDIEDQLDDMFIGDLGSASDFPALANPSVRSSLYNSFTFELLIKNTTQAIYAGTSNAVLRLQDDNLTLRFGGVTTRQLYDSNTNNLTSQEDAGEDEISGYWGIGFEDGEFTSVNDWYHLAYVKDGNQARCYFGGKIVAILTVSSNYWNRISELELSGSYVNGCNGSLPVMFAAHTGTYVDNPSAAIHGMRWTPLALYSGNTISPPTAITTLAAS